MSAVLRLVDSLGERSIERADFPLAIGGAGCAVALGGAPAGPVAWLGLRDDDLFLQQVVAGQVLHNGAPAQSSHWLHAGDVITVGKAVLRLRNVDGVRDAVGGRWRRGKRHGAACDRARGRRLRHDCGRLRDRRQHAVPGGSGRAPIGRCGVIRARCCTVVSPCSWC